MNELVVALGPVFAAGFAVQQLVEMLNPLVDKVLSEVKGRRKGEGEDQDQDESKAIKKLILGSLSVAVGLALAFGAGLRVLQPLGVTSAGFWDAVVTGLIVSAGTEGVNSILKFLGYTKEKKKAEAERAMDAAGSAALALAERA
jgi:hypothetical protein